MRTKVKSTTPNKSLFKGGITRCNALEWLSPKEGILFIATRHSSLITYLKFSTSIRSLPYWSIWV